MLEGAGIPVVETWELPEKPIDQAVGFSNSEAMSLLVRSLAKKGYRKFGYIGGSTLRDARGNMRRDGVIRSLDELGLASDRMISFGVPPISMEQGSQAIVRMLNRWPDTEVVVCVSDLLAFGAMAECQRLGMKVPDDIAFAGFGDYQISAYCHPKITTVHVDCYGIGKVAAQKISRAIRGEESPGQEKTTIVDFSVIERESA
jgi:Transcriptional regulators